LRDLAPELYISVDGVLALEVESMAAETAGNNLPLAHSNSSPTFSWSTPARRHAAATGYAVWHPAGDQASGMGDLPQLHPPGNGLGGAS
jgi:hypothetical protein